MIDPYAIDNRPLRDFLPRASRAMFRYLEPWILPETRPSRLLGPAVGMGATLERGVCPICGVTLGECRMRQAGKPLGPGSHGYSRSFYPDLRIFGA